MILRKKIEPLFLILTWYPFIHSIISIYSFLQLMFSGYHLFKKRLMKRTVSSPVPGTKMEFFSVSNSTSDKCWDDRKGSSLPSLLSEILTPIQLGSISLFLSFCINHSFINRHIYWVPDILLGIRDVTVSLECYPVEKTAIDQIITQVVQNCNSDKCTKISFLPLITSPATSKNVAKAAVV